MKDNSLKQLAKVLLFRPGTVRRICVGPLRGMVFRVSAVTGLSPWYSGAEREHQKTFKRLVRKSDVVLDIGANWGLHTLYLSRLVEASGRVVAVECYPRAFTELEWHLSANNCLNVSPLPIAISDRNGESLFLAGESSSTGSLAVVSQHPELQSDTIAVTTRTLDSVVEALGLKRVALVKIDVEGAEGRVLCGAERITARFRPYFVIDLHTPEQDVFVAQWLTDHGYRLKRLIGSPILRTDVGWPDPTGVWGSILALPDRSNLELCI